MRTVILTLLSCIVLTVPVRAWDIPQELRRALPQEAVELMGEDYSPEGLVDVLSALPGRLLEAGREILREGLGGAASVLLVAVVCAAMSWTEEPILPMAGGLAVAMLSAGNVEELIGLGADTVEQMNTFSTILLPTLAASAAVSGAAVTASVQQMTAMVLVSIITGVIREFLLPMTYLYIAAITAGHCLQETRLTAVAGGMKKGITWLLAALLLCFTLYLSVSRVLAGATDAAAVKLTKTAISGAVPVVGGIIADAAETVLAGAAMVKATVGVFGVLGVLGMCALPFLRIAVQYLLYKAAAFLASVMGVGSLGKLIDGIGDAFALVLGMAGGCAVLVLVSVFCFLGAVGG